MGRNAAAGGPTHTHTPTHPHALVRVTRVLILLLFLLGGVRQAGALNQRMYPLGELVKDAECIALGRAVAVDVPKMRAALVVEETLKGQVPYRWMALNVAPGGWGHPPAMIRRLGPGVPIVYFAARVKGRHVVLGYTNGTWFQITAPEGGQADALPWTFTHCEVFLRRTFGGPTAELEQVLRDVLAGKRDAPAPNPGQGQGMGPEVPRDFKSDRSLPALPDFIAKAIAEPKSGGVVRKIAVRPLTEAEQQWVNERAKQFQRPPEETAMLLAQAKYVVRDAQRALEYERDHGRGGNRAWVRSAEEILDLKQRSDRLSWLDVRGVLMRAGELFTPVTDPVDLIHGLRTKFSWDELDPMFDDDKWGRKKLNEEVEKRLAARSPHPLGPGDRVKSVLYSLDFGAAGTGTASLESCGWKLLPNANWDSPRRQFDWDGGEAGSQRPGAFRTPVPGAQHNPIANQPPAAGLPLGGRGGVYAGGSLWFATGIGDADGRDRGRRGAQAYYDQGWTAVHQGASASFLFIAQVYTPDHTDEVGEPRNGWFYINRCSRYIDAGIRLVDAETKSVSLLPEQALLLKVEPSLGRFDRVLLRVDVFTHKEEGKRNTEGRNEVKLIAYADGIGEVARATVDLNRARKGDRAALDASDEGVAFAPAFGTRTAGEGYVPEFYLARVSLHQLNSAEPGAIKQDLPAGQQAQAPAGPSRAAAQPRLEAEPAVRKPASALPEPRLATGRLAAAVPGNGRAVEGPRSLVIALDTSSSMAPLLEKARASAVELLASLKPGDRFELLDSAAEIKPYAPDWRPVTADEVRKATAWLQGLRVSAGTNISGLLERAFAFKGVTGVVMITDGGPPSRGVTDAEQLVRLSREKNPAGARFDALLVVQAPTDNIASRLAQQNHGLTRFR